jgi:perosamine synthetase
VYVVKLPAGVDRDAVMARLSAEGIATAPYLPSIHLQSYMRERYGFGEGMCPVSEDASARTMALPFHARLTREDQERVVETLRTALDAA